MFNTLAIAIIGTIGAVSSAVVVAYGFSRFRIPGKTILFTILVGTIILPQQVTIVPTYAHVLRIGWVGTWLPLLVPHFFANAYNVFLLRQFFMSIPREMDEAAMIDGAEPVPHAGVGDRAAVVAGDYRGVSVPLLLRLERLPGAAGVPGRARRAVADLGRHVVLHGQYRSCRT